MSGSEPVLDDVCVYYCRTYYKAVRSGGEEESGGPMMCYETLDFGLWSVYFAVTLASTGPLKLFR